MDAPCVKHVLRVDVTYTTICINAMLTLDVITATKPDFIKHVPFSSDMFFMTPVEGPYTPIGIGKKPVNECFEIHPNSDPHFMLALNQMNTTLLPHVLYSPSHAVKVFAKIIDKMYRNWKVDGIGFDTHWRSGRLWI